MNRTTWTIVAAMVTSAALVGCGSDDTSGASSTSAGGGSTSSSTGAGGDGGGEVGVVCGNGAIGEGETCDDGNKNGGDGCDASCAVEKGYKCEGEPSICKVRCGDAILLDGESCDDGNLVGTDGCDGNCIIEAGFTCSGEPSVCIETCGDGLVVGDETCDDGNLTAGDGCDATCLEEVGFLCDGGDPTLCMEICGDSMIVGVETCDDGNTDLTDGCDDTCAIETGYACTGEPSVCGEVCGDGLIVGGETCDDSNTTLADGCDDLCAIETGYACASEPSVCTAICGDGMTTGPETCDDGGVVDGDGCSSTCATDAGWTCMGMPSACSTICGDSLISGNETCDDGNNTGGDGCGAGCGIESGYACVGLPSVCTTVCGDGLVKGGETCDDTNTTAGDGCDAACATETGYACAGAPSVCLPICGDGLVTGAEACDDGNLVAGDGCGTTCLQTVGFTCTGAPSVCATTCGDGIQAGVEACDDGNLIDGDCCSSSCVIEAGCEVEPNGTFQTANDYAALQQSQMLYASINPAGDKDYFKVVIPAGQFGLITASTAGGLTDLCAPGGAINTELTVYDIDGVSPLAFNDDNPGNSCSTVSTTWLPGGTYYVRAGSSTSLCAACTFNYSVQIALSIAACGNGAVEASEQCDDGNTAGGDGCGPTCLIECSAEIEPNATSATASGPFAAAVTTCGDITPAGDVDWFAITIPATADLRIESFTGSYGACANDTVIDFIGTNGVTTIASDDDDGITSCSLLNSTAAADAAMRHLPAGTYYVKLTDFGSNDVINSYFLNVSFNALCGNAIVEGVEECDGGPTCDAFCDRIPVCGDGFVDAPEACDDGNVVSGDGCDSTCLPEICPGGTPVVINSTDIPKSILDNTTVQSLVTVPNVGVVTATFLEFNITHTYDGDLDISLISPALTTIDITSDNGLSGDNYTNTMFSSTNVPPCPPVTGGVAPFTGCYSPEQSLTTLNGQAANGVWKLSIADDASSDTGTLNSWKLTVCVQ